MSQGRILLVSDKQAVTIAVSALLAVGGFEVITADNPGAALSYLDGSFDAAVLKYGLKDCDIKSFIQQILFKDSHIAVLLVVENTDVDVISEFPQNGVMETVRFPLHNENFLYLIKTAAHMHQSALAYKRVVASLEERNASLQKQNIFLARRIEESSKSLSRLYDDLRSTYLRTVKSLIEAIDARDHYTRSHSQKVSRYAVMIAEEMGLSVKDIENIRQASELHDVGKIGIEDRILTKPGPLDNEEWEQIKLHSIKGAQILEPLIFLEGAALIVRQNHERYDGKGYPDGLKGEEITLGARIVCIADAYDVMTSVRSYRKEVMGKQGAIEEVKLNSGKQFDPKVVEAFLRAVDRF